MLQVYKQPDEREGAREGRGREREGRGKGREGKGGEGRGWGGGGKGVSTVLNGTTGTLTPDLWEDW